MENEEMEKMGVELVERREEVDRLQKVLDKELLPFKERMTPLLEQLDEIREEMKKATVAEEANLKASKADVELTKKKMIENWGIPAKRYTMEDGTEITLASRKGYEINDEEALLERCKGFEKPPYKAKWDKGKLIALVDTGIIPSAEAVLTETKYLSVKPSKKEETKLSE
jgi:hypothetical protein